MPRAQNKSQLLADAEINFEQLMTLINSLEESKQKTEFPAGSLNRNIRDVLCHLYHWQMMFFDWYETGMSGKKSAMPSEGYSWRELPALNAWIQTKYSKTDIDDAKIMLTKSHQKTINLIKYHLEADLFERSRFAWTGTTTLAAYLISAAPSHYTWALKLIKQQIKHGW